MAKVVARVVLAQAGQAAPHVALGGDDFQAQAKFAGVAKAHHLRAPGVSSQVAANGAAAFRGQTQGKQKPCLFAGLLQSLQHASGFYGDGQVGGVQGADGVHAREAQHDLRAAGVWRGADHHAGVAALGHDAHTGLRAGFHHLGHLGGGTGAHHSQGLAALAFAPVQFIAGQVALSEDVRVAHDGAQGSQKFRSAHESALLGESRSGKAPCALALRSRSRTWSAQAANRVRHKNTSKSA